MKKTLVILLCVSWSYFSMAQEKIKQKEVGIAFSNLDNFGLTFKTGSEKSLWRFNTLFMSGSNTNQFADSSETNNNNIGFVLKIGKEFRKTVAKKLELRYGADISFTYSQSKYNMNDNTVDDDDYLTEYTRYTPGVNLVFGLNYVFNESFVIGAELLPYFAYYTGTSIRTTPWENEGEPVESDISGYNYGLSSTSVLLSLSYRF